MGTSGGSSLVTATITTAPRNSSLEGNSTIGSVIFGYMEKSHAQTGISAGPDLDIDQRRLVHDKWRECADDDR
jgi:hypothetical protein